MKLNFTFLPTVNPEKSNDHIPFSFKGSEKVS